MGWLSLIPWRQIGRWALALLTLGIVARELRKDGAKDALTKRDKEEAEAALDAHEKITESRNDLRRDGAVVERLRKHGL